MTASKVLDKLAAGIFSAPAHVMLREVRNGTGYSRAARTADALVTSVWPSRGIWFAGVEVKVSRSDWLSELKQPDKSYEVQRFCDHWYIAAPPGIVEPGEVPATWGHIEVNAKCRVVKQAPKLTAEPLSAVFVASVMRKLAASQGALLSEAKSAGAASVEITQVGADMQQVREEQQRMRLELLELQGLKNHVAAFEKASGLDIAHGWNQAELGRAVRVVLQMPPHQFQYIADRARNLAAVAEQIAIELVPQVAAQPKPQPATP